VHERKERADMALWPLGKKKIRETGAPPRLESGPFKGTRNAFVKTKVSAGDFRDWAGKSTVSIPLGANVLADYSRAYKFFFRTVSRYYPMAAAAVWTWTNLCSTRQKLTFTGGEDSEREKAKLIINDLDQRISPFDFVQGGGMDVLLGQFFHYLFTYGRFSGELKLSRDISRVESFKIGDPFWVRFTKKEREAYSSTDGVDYYKTNPHSFFFYALDMDWENPYGVAMIESAWSLMQMADNMLKDLSASSANAGVPRMHIKIKAPAMQEDEEQADYTNRANSYFDAYVNNFSDIAPDDNFYSWDDISIGVVGGHPGASGFVWRMNRQILDEEIIAGFHLFPWIVGKSTQTTKNWVRSQFDLIMAQVETIQKIGKRFSEWIRNTELALNGITTVKAHQSFEPVRDPARKDIAIAERFEIANVESKVKDRFISPDDGARELGYDKAYEGKKFPYGKTSEDGETVHKDDKNDEGNEILLEQMEMIGDKIDDLTHKESTGCPIKEREMK